VRVGEAVVVEGVQRLRDGRPVQIIGWDTDAAAPGAGAQ
jgi:hypothetical protein